MVCKYKTLEEHVLAIIARKPNITIEELVRTYASHGFKREWRDVVLELCHAGKLLRNYDDLGYPHYSIAK